MDHETIARADKIIAALIDREDIFQNEPTPGSFIWEHDLEILCLLAVEKKGQRFLHSLQKEKKSKINEAKPRRCFSCGQTG